MKISLNTPEDPIPAKIKNGFTFEIKTKDHEVYMYDDYEPTDLEQQNQNNNRQLNNKKNSGSRKPMTAPPPII